MKIKRITLQFEVPARLMSANGIKSAFSFWFSQRNLPHRIQVIESTISPNTTLRNSTKFTRIGRLVKLGNGDYV